MVLSDIKVKKLLQRILLSRMRILNHHGFFGLLLMHITFSVDENIKTAATDGERIIFSPEFIDTLSDNELDFVMMHEILHIALQHCMREGDFNKELYNMACDIVVNSNILLENHMDKSSITLKQYGESIHIAPNGEEGYKYTAEQVYGMLTKNVKDIYTNNMRNDEETCQWDDHSYWGSCEDNALLKDIWTKYLEDAAQSISFREQSKSYGMLPEFAKRILNSCKKAQTDWRTILNEFIQSEVCDYSFFPPDKRFSESEFFLPDFNEREEKAENILFMIDTSGSMTDNMVTAAYSEVLGAIEQFNGRLSGWLGFFDCEVKGVRSFSDSKEAKKILPSGGGGTNFNTIFEYVNKYMYDKTLTSIIILTDGNAPFPDENITQGVPVLWLLNNFEVEPTWGKVARINM